MHEGNVVTVEGGIMHELKASALAARDHYYIARVHSLQKGICYFDNYIFTRVATVDMALWEDTRIVPRDNQLWSME